MSQLRRVEDLEFFCGDDYDEDDMNKKTKEDVYSSILKSFIEKNHDVGDDVIQNLFELIVNITHPPKNSSVRCYFQILRYFEFIPVQVLSKKYLLDELPSSIQNLPIHKRMINIFYSPNFTQIKKNFDSNIVSKVLSLYINKISC